jgi:DNA-binding NarL/FixJ family response regulator
VLKFRFSDYENKHITSGEVPYCEDHPIVSESLFRLVNESFDNVVCIHASTGSKGLAYLNSNHFDLVLLDINPSLIFPVLSSATGLKARFPELKISRRYIYGSA